MDTQEFVQSYEARLTAYEDSLKAFEAQRFSDFYRQSQTLEEELDEATPEPSPLAKFFGREVRPAEAYEGFNPENSYAENLAAYEQDLRNFRISDVDERLSKWRDKLVGAKHAVGNGAAVTYGFGKKAVGYTGRKVGQGFKYLKSQVEDLVNPAA